MSIQTLLKQFTGPYSVATVENGEPRVRPPLKAVLYQTWRCGDRKPVRQLYIVPALKRGGNKR